MPVWRSPHCLACLGWMCACWLTRSMTMKSLPMPCILVKRRSMVSASTGQRAFAGIKLLHALAAAHLEGLLAIHQHLRGAAAAVVVGAHDETIGTGRAHGQQIAFGQGQFAVLGEEVAGLADRPDDVVAAGLAGT